MPSMPCKINGCENPSKARGMCATHYGRWRLGRPLDTPVRKLTGSAKESFAVRTRWNGDCLEWTGAVHEFGYGIIWDRKRVVRAHRWAYEQEHGPIPEGHEIDHMCSNRLCVNVKHLRLASHKQNSEHLGLPRSNNKSGVRGVSRTKEGDKWRVRVKHNYREYLGGVFDNLEDAERAAIALRDKLFTHNIEKDAA